MMSPRIAPPMIGLGLVEAIPEADIRAKADPDDADKDGISGRTNEVWSLRDKAVRSGPLRLEGGRAEHHGSRRGCGCRRCRPLEPARAAAPRVTARRRKPMCQNAPNGNTEAAGGFELPERTARSRRVLFAEPGRAPRRGAGAATLCCAARRCSMHRDARRATCRRTTTGEVAEQPHSQQAAHLAVYRFPAARHGRRARGRTAGGRGRRSGMAHRRRCGAWALRRP